MLPSLDPRSDTVDAPEAILHEVFGYSAFRGQQQAIVEHDAPAHAIQALTQGGALVSKAPAPA